MPNKNSEEPVTITFQAFTSLDCILIMKQMQRAKTFTPTFTFLPLNINL